MKKLVICLLGLGLITSAAFAGTEYSGKEMKQVTAPPPCPEWYANNEFNVSLWGTYVFTGTEWINDRYVQADHAWGVAETSITSSCVTSVSESKAGPLMQIRPAKKRSPISAITSSTKVFTAKET